MEFQNKITGIPPAITAPWVKKYLRDWCLSSGKAGSELGYQITLFEDGAQKTIKWLRENSLLKKSIRLPIFQQCIILPVI